jgi:hypothetical protein
MKGDVDSMSSSIEDDPGSQAYHIMFTREQHRRLRLVCTTLGVPMAPYIRDLISRDVDRRFVKLGLDRVPIPRRTERKPGRIGRPPAGKPRAAS